MTQLNFSYTKTGGRFRSPVFINHCKGTGMKRKLTNLGILLIFIAGLTILLYPLASNLWNQKQQDKIISGYAKTIDQSSEDQVDAMWEKAREYNHSLRQDQIIVDPFDQIRQRRVKGDYYSTLNPGGDGSMATLEIPKINLSLPVMHGSGASVLQTSVGHLEQSSMPVGGKTTHAVLMAHRGLPTARLFTDIDRLEIGDRFYLRVLNQILVYEVDQIKVVDPDDLQYLAITDGKDMVTLMTCTPYGINSHRLLVRGSRVLMEQPESEELEALMNSSEINLMVLFYLILAETAGILLCLYLLGCFKKKKKKTDTAD